MAEKIVATVAGRDITEKEFNEFVARIPQQQQAYVQTPEGRQQALTQYANYFLFEKLGEERGYVDSEEFQNILSYAKTELLSQYALTQLVKDITASEEECKKYYEDNKERFAKGAQARAKHILTNEEDECLKAKKEIEAGEKTFEEAAKEYSTCPSKAQGGDLGPFGRGQMVPEFDKAVFEGEVGKLIGPVKTQFGYHLIFIDSLEEGSVADFAEVYPQIRQQIVNEKQNETYMAARAELMEKYGCEFK
ncbi:MAG: peptidylprolyl isomerase [Eubacteriales bacterium]|nr:peptidylprolyl isomerase [Eubacteriales bacterium]